MCRELIHAGEKISPRNVNAFVRMEEVERECGIKGIGEVPRLRYNTMHQARPARDRIDFMLVVLSALQRCSAQSSAQTNGRCTMRTANAHIRIVTITQGQYVYRRPSCICRNTAMRPSRLCQRCFRSARAPSTQSHSSSSTLRTTL